MATISDFTKAYDVQPNTIRQWSKTFGDFLAPGANPPKGEIRNYSNEDAQVIALIATMRQDRASYETIRAALASGIREQWPPPSPKTDQDAPGQQDKALALINQLTVKASSLEGELGAIKGERDHLREQLETERDARLAAEIRAAAAEAQIESKRIGWFDRLLGRG